MPPGADKRKVLLVDDDPSVRMILRDTLEPDFVVTEAGGGREGLRAFYAERPDLVVLDITMPDLDGCAVLQRIRELADTPIIMLTANAADEQIVGALEHGADEYVTKPFSPAVLAARVRALLRRDGLTPPRETLRVELDHGRLVVDAAAGRVWVRGSEVSLSPTELRLLLLLVRHADQVVGTGQILHQVWGSSYGADEGYVTTYIRRLRAKIEPDPKAPQYIRARRGLGYVLVRQPTDDARPNADR